MPGLYGYIDNSKALEYPRPVSKGLLSGGQIQIFRDLVGKR
jgi:hypothetical protein